jgi:hypothetical protein
LRVASPVLVAVLAVTVIAAQAPRRDPGNTFTGRVISVSPSGNSFVVRGVGGKEVTLYSGPRSTYRMGGRDVRFQDIREGWYVTAPYETSGERYIVGNVTLSESARDDRERSEGGAGLRGQILKAHSDPNHLVIRTADGKELLLYLPDGNLSFTFETRGGKRVLTSMTAAAAAREDQSRVPTEISGTVVRVVGTDNQFIVRTADGKEMTFYADPTARYEFAGQAGTFRDLREGVPVNIGFQVREGRHYANRIIGRPRR